MVRGSKNKNRTRPARRRTLLLSALTAAALAAGFGGSGIRPASAAGYVYQQHTLNAGVLVTQTAALGAGQQYDPAPYLFYVLNNRPDVRPADLNLVNPLAPAGMSPASAAYWEVSLNNISDSQLAQYNVLYLPAGNVMFQPNVNEKLRRFVDGGGQLIVEYGKAPSITGLFTGTGTGSAQVTQVTFPAVGALSLLQPIVSQPYLLTTSDLTSFASTANPVPFPLLANTGDSIHSGEFGSLFSPALAASPGGTSSVVSAAQLGAGQVVASTLNIGGVISVDATYQNSTTNAYIFNPANLYAAPAPDLKLLANILNWSETHPSENKTSHGNASSTGLASFSPAWQYALTGTTPPAGAAVWGNFVFAVDANGVLRAFDAYPSETLTTAAANGPADDGKPDYSLGSSYDEIWDTGGSNTSLAGASAPTVASVGRANYVFVEKRDGTIAAYNILDGSTPFTLNAPASGGTFPATMNAPAPTIYDGRLYAGQADGTLHVYDLNEGTTGVVVQLNSTVQSGGEPVTAAPSVGLLADGNTSVLIAVVPTTLNVYTVLLGGRNEPLVPYPTVGTQTGYSISRQGRYGLPNIFADVNTAGVPTLVPYNYNGLVLNVGPNNSAPTPQDPLFTTTATGGYFTDWNMDFANAAGTSTPGTPVNLNFVAASPYSELSSTPTAAAISAPAIARNGDYYYTETLTSTGAVGGTAVTNSYLIGVRNSPLYSRVQLKFRFLIPTTTGFADGDSVNYTPIFGFHFVGAPVVDDQDNVYVAATNGTLATVLCFQGDQQVSASTSAAVDLSSDTITQPDENGGEANTIVRGDDTETFGQFLGSATSIQFYNFGRPGLTTRQIAGDLTEPQPLSAVTNDGTSTTTPLLMHTNLSWFVTPFAVTGAVTGLTQVGTSLLLTDGTSLYRLPTNPLVGTGRVVSTGPSIAPVGAGTVASPPSVGGSVLVVNGTSEIAARTRQITVIADSNRVLGVDGDGNAVWAVDATTRTDTSQTPSVSTKVGFSHPTALSQFAPNDYLVADPGTNRCVRFDSAGNVQWELTRFQDPNGLMGAGQPLTLSQPSSVVTRTAVVSSGAAQYAGDTATYYLVADSGNNRVIEVADFVNPTTGVTDGNHVLTWASHTGDRYGRSYRYGSAAYYPNSTISSGISIAATVTNTRLAPLAANGNLGAVSGDAPGGSLVVFNYPASPQAFSAAPTNDLVYTTAGFYAEAAGGVYTPFTIRSPRFLQLYTPSPASSPTPPNSAVAPFDFLYADDNGAFDLSYDATRSAFVAGPDRLQFTAANYQSMTQPAVGVAGAVARTGLPFIPTCVQGLSSDTQGTGSSAVTTRRYLITQNYSQGELGTLAASGNGKIGGEVFEADVTYPVASPATQATTTPGGFGVNATLSHPNLTGPLTQPTYAVRLP